MKRIAVLSLILSVLLCSCGGHIFDGNRASFEGAKNFLSNRQESAEKLYSYFKFLDCYSLTIYLDEYKAVVLRTSNGYNLSREDINIEDKELKRAIRSLYFAGGESFYADEAGFNIVIWTSLADFGAGIVYNESNSESTAHTQIQFLTKLSRINDNGYFYYESDYNKYRAEHRN